MRRPRAVRQPDSTSSREAIPLRRIALWMLVAVAIIIGIALYFIYEPRVATLVV